MSKSLIVLSLTLAVTAAAHAQNVRTPVAPAPVVAPAQADMMKLQMTMMDAQQKAIKPGDEALPCEALQKELLSTMNDPAIQAYAAKTNAAYAKEAAQKKGPMTPDAAATLAAALAAGAATTGAAGMPAITPGQAMTPQQMQQMMAAQQQASIAYMSQLAPIMPALMRSQRVTMLAVTKNCVWATGGAALYPGVAPGVAPGSIPQIPGVTVPR
jgi:hypothetical protein